MRELLELPISRENVRTAQPLEAFGAEILDAEASDHAAMDHGAPQLKRARRSTFRQISDTATGEAVASTGRVLDALEWVSRGDEIPGVGEHHGPILPFLDDENVRPEAQD